MEDVISEIKQELAKLRTTALMRSTAAIRLRWWILAGGTCRWSMEG